MISKKGNRAYGVDEGEFIKDQKKKLQELLKALVDKKNYIGIRPMMKGVIYADFEDVMCEFMESTIKSFIKKQKEIRVISIQR